MKIDNICSFFCMFPKGTVMYLRSLPPDRMVHGIFDDEASLRLALSEYELDNFTWYFNCNVFKAEFLDSMAKNQFHPIQVNEGLRNEHIEKVQYVIIDVDIKPMDESTVDERGKRLATDEENSRAIDMAKEIKQYLSEQGFTGVGVLSSGNGSYVFAPMKRLKCLEGIEAVKSLLEDMAERFNTEQIHVDITTATLSHIFKCPGAISKKGCETEGIKYRHAEVVEAFDYNKRNNWSVLEAYTDKVEAEKKKEKKMHRRAIYVEGSMGNFWDYDAICEMLPLDFSCYRDQWGNLYMAKSDDSTIYSIESSEGVTAIRKWARELSKQSYVPPKATDAALTMAMDCAREGEPIYLYNRVKVTEDEILYNLGNGETVQITSKGVEVIKTPARVFIVDETDAEQCRPDLNVDPKELQEMLKPYINIIDIRNWVIFLTYMCVTFFDVNMPVMFLSGEKGSSKSTCCRFMQSLINPKTTGLYHFPDNERDLGLLLAKDFFLCLDNTTGFGKAIANLLCIACTGGVIRERKLYTNSETVTRSIRTKLVMNGLSLISQQDDFLDRCITIELLRIDASVRKTEGEINREFEKIKPKIFGALCIAVSKAMTYKVEEIENPIRMIDFEKKAIALGMAMGFTQKQVEQSYAEQKKEMNIKVVEEMFMLKRLLILMDGYDKKEWVVSDLHRLCCYEKDKIVQGMPQSPAAFSRKLSNYRSDLAAVGISFEIRNKTQYRKIYVLNDGSYIKSEAQRKKEIAEDRARMEARKEASQNRVRQIIDDDEDEEIKK